MGSLAFVSRELPAGLQLIWKINPGTSGRGRTYHFYLRDEAGYASFQIDSLAGLGNQLRSYRQHGSFGFSNSDRWPAN